MTAVESTLDPRADTERDERISSLTAIVDCDVHPMIGDTALLRPHMSSRAARRAFGPVSDGYAPPQHARLVTNRLNHPTSALRLDATPPGGGIPGSDPSYALEHWIDPYGISAALLIPVQSGIVIPWGDEVAGAEYLTALNSYFLDTWVGADSRYRLPISISPYHIPSGVAEIERLAAVPGIAAVFIPYGSVEFGRSHYFPIYEAAEEYGLPIVMHQTGGEGNACVSPRLAGGLPNTWAERHTQLFQPGQAILASMLWGGVFERFPRLKLVLVEFSLTWILPMLWRMDHVWEQGDQTLAGLSKPPSHYVRENVRFSTQPLDEPPSSGMLADYLDIFDAGDLLVFSSDYPHYDNDDPRHILTTCIPARMREKVAYKNALDCFGSRLGL